MQDNLRGTDVDLREVEYAACNGMLHTLDPHSVLLSPDAYKEMNLSTSGQFGGLGIVISHSRSAAHRHEPDAGHARRSRAGLKTLRSHHEDQQRVHAQHGPQRGRQSPPRRARHARSPSGSTATAPRAGRARSRSSSRARSSTSRPSSTSCSTATSATCASSSSRRNTSSELDDALADMKKNGELKGLVLDLRGNPGGLLDQAAKVADKFVADGPDRRHGRQPERRPRREVAHAEGTEPNYPLALLVSGSSRERERDRRRRAQEPRPRRHRRRDDVRQGQRAARLHRLAGQGRAQAHDRAVPHRAGRRLDPGRRRHARHRARPDDGRHARDGPRRRRRACIKERDLSRSLSNARAHEGQPPDRRSCATTSRTKERQELRERGGDPDDNFDDSDFPIKFARDLVGARPAGQAPRPGARRRSSSSQTRARAELEKVADDLKGSASTGATRPPTCRRCATPAPRRRRREGRDRPRRTTRSPPASR